MENYVTHCSVNAIENEIGIVGDAIPERAAVHGDSLGTPEVAGITRLVDRVAVAAVGDGEHHLVPRPADAHLRVRAVAVSRALGEERNEGDGGGFGGVGMIITGSVVTAGAARTLFGKDPQ